MATALTYDAVPYSVSAFRQTDPDRLAVLARLYDLESAAPQACRVLELGCASGGNLLPMALAYPKSFFVGIDLSQRQIAEGNEVVRELGLANLKLEHLSITDVTKELGEFDYILAHGVYSWVPPMVQDKILQICSENLADTGAAYISYNTYPGWHVRGMIREMICYQTQAENDPALRAKAARRHLEYLQTFFATSTAPVHPVLAKEIADLLKCPDTYILHDYLEDYNEPLYFHEFLARAKAKGLQYLAEAEIASMLPARFGKETEAKLREMSPDPLHLEQSMDFLRNRTFRQTLVCHERHPLDHELRADAVLGFYVASPMKAESASPEVVTDKAESFVDPGRPKLTTRSPVMKGAFWVLSQEWPRPMAFAELLKKVRGMIPEIDGGTGGDEEQLAAGLLNCYTAGVVEFSVAPPGFVLEVSDRPVTSAYVRHRVRVGAEVTNLRLENIALTEPARLVLSHLDGEHDRGKLASLVAELLKKTGVGEGGGETVEHRAGRYVEYILPTFAKAALLVG